MNFLNKKKLHKILLISVLIFMVFFVDLFNVFSFESLIKISNANNQSGISVNISIGNQQDIPDPPTLSCPSVFLGNPIWDALGINTSSNTFFICFLYIAAKIFTILIWMAIVLSILAITYYGILYIVKPSSSSNVTKNIIWAVVGLIISLSAFTLVQLITFSLFSFNSNLDNISNLYFFWFINKFQFINVTQAYVEGGVVQNNNLSFGYLGEKLILGFGLPMLASLLASTNLPELLNRLLVLINDFSNLRLSFCPDLPNIFSSSVVSDPNWAECVFSFIYLLINLLSWLALVLSVIFIAWFGILYIIQPTEAQKTHSRLKYAFIGLIVSLSAIMIINLIINLILALS